MRDLVPTGNWTCPARPRPGGGSGERLGVPEKQAQVPGGCPLVPKKGREEPWPAGTQAPLPWGSGPRVHLLRASLGERRKKPGTCPEHRPMGPGKAAPPIIHTGNRRPAGLRGDPGPMVPPPAPHPIIPALSAAVRNRNAWEAVGEGGSLPPGSGSEGPGTSRGVARSASPRGPPSTRQRWEGEGGCNWDTARWGALLRGPDEGGPDPQGCCGLSWKKAGSKEEALLLPWPGVLCPQAAFTLRCGCCWER